MKIYMIRISDSAIGRRRRRDHILHSKDRGRGNERDRKREEEELEEGDDDLKRITLSGLERERVLSIVVKDMEVLLLYVSEDGRIPRWFTQHCQAQEIFRCLNEKVVCRKLVIHAAFEVEDEGWQGEVSG